jgi:transcriptional regulator with XRE-family HTH domain
VEICFFIGNFKHKNFTKYVDLPYCGNNSQFQYHVFVYIAYFLFDIYILFYPQSIFSDFLVKGHQPMLDEHNSYNSYSTPDPYTASDLAIGRRIHSCRESAHMTQKELADRLGVSTSYISCLESGRRPLTHKIALSLIRILNVSYDYLILGQTAPGINLPGSVCETASYNERLKFEHLLENCTKAEYEMCYQLCNAYLNTSRSKLPHSGLKNNPPPSGYTLL